MYSVEKLKRFLKQCTVFHFSKSCLRPWFPFFFFISVTPLKMLKGRGKSKGRGSSANSSHSVSSSASNSPSSMSVENQLKCQTMLCSLRVQANDKYCATKLNKLIYSRRHAAFNNWVVKLCFVVIIQKNYYQKTSSPSLNLVRRSSTYPLGMALNYSGLGKSDKKSLGSFFQVV